MAASKKTNSISKEYADKCRSVIARTWSAICHDMEPTTKNIVAIEVALDADYAENYGGPKSDVEAMRDITRTLIDIHGYDATLKGLAKHIRLV